MLTEDEREFRQFQRWLAKQRQDAKEETNTALEPVEDARAQLVLASARLYELRTDLERLEFEYQEGLERLERYKKDINTWQITLKARVTRGIEEAVRRIDELKEDADGVAAVRELRDRVSRLLALRDYKPRRALDIPAEELKIQQIISEHVPDVDVQYQFLKARLCAACGAAKLAGFHPLCLNCQRRCREGKLRGDWTGIKLLREAQKAVQSGGDLCPEDSWGSISEGSSRCDSLGSGRDPLGGIEGS